PASPFIRSSPISPRPIFAPSWARAGSAAAPPSAWPRFPATRRWKSRSSPRLDAAPAAKDHERDMTATPEQRLSSRLQAVKPSPTIAMTRLAAELRRQGKEIIGLSQGEPDFDTPEHIRQAAKAAIDAGQTRYTDVDGTPELKQAVAAKFKRENGLDYGLDQISV